MCVVITFAMVRRSFAVQEFKASWDNIITAVIVILLTVRYIHIIQNSTVTVTSKKMFETAVNKIVVCSLIEQKLIMIFFSYPTLLNFNCICCFVEICLRVSDSQFS
jgi:hypothetical protein